MKKYVILRHLTLPDKGFCFFTTNTGDKDIEYGSNGEQWYEIVGYADTVEEAQILCATKRGIRATFNELLDYYRSNK